MHVSRIVMITNFASGSKVNGDMMSLSTLFYTVELIPSIRQVVVSSLSDVMLKVVCDRLLIPPPCHAHDIVQEPLGT